MINVFLNYNVKIAFLLPALVILLFYVSASIIFVYRHRKKLDLNKILDEIEHKRYWNGALYAIAGLLITVADSFVNIKFFSLF